jgi:hypothetical protein
MDNHKNSTALAAWQLTIESRLEVVLWLVFLTVPLVIGLTWGTYLDDSAYVTFRYARNLASGRGLTDELIAGGQTPLRAPLYALVLALAARLGAPLPQVGLILSVLGWGATAIAIYSIGRGMRWPVAAVASAILVVFNPAVVSTLGTEIPWTVALAWIAIVSSIRGQWTSQTCALVLMICTHFDLSTLALAALLLIIRWVERRRFPVWPTVVVAIAALGWWLMAAWQIAAPFNLSYPNLAEWGYSIQQLLDESEFYWLFLPLMGMGLLATTRKTLWAGLLWGAISILSGGAAARAMMTVLGLFLVGLGIGWFIKWIEMHNLVRLDRFTLAVSLVLVAGLPPGIAQASSLLQRYQFRPVIRQALEQQAADWLRAHSEPTATVLGSERVGYLADRPTFPWDGGNSGSVELANLLGPLTESPPAYCVSFRSIAWDSLMQTTWFQDGYEPLEKFESPYDATSPFTIWGHRLRAFDPGDRQPQNVRLPNGVDWVGYEYWPDRIQPGGAVHVTLFLQATQPVTESFRTVVRVVSPQDGAAWAQRNLITPRNVPLDWWQIGQVVAEQFVLTTTADIPVGGYQLNVSVAAPGSRSLLPMYRHDDTAALDRITLGYVAVPWRDKLSTAKPVGANLGNQISLLGFEAPDSLSPGTEFDVTLYWEALQPPEDDYVVFVHLLDASGQPVASHDGPPMDGRYPTKAWLPGDVVPDIHRVVLNPDVYEGTYRLQAGMYQWPSIERLPVWDREGVEQTDRVVVLQSVEVQ